MYQWLYVGLGPALLDHRRNTTKDNNHSVHNQNQNTSLGLYHMLSIFKKRGRFSQSTPGKMKGTWSHLPRLNETFIAYARHAYTPYGCLLVRLRFYLILIHYVCAVGCPLVMGCPTHRHCSPPPADSPHWKVHQEISLQIAAQTPFCMFYYGKIDST